MENSSLARLLPASPSSLARDGSRRRPRIASANACASPGGTSCAAGQVVTNQSTVVALVLSTGKNGAQGTGGANEVENQDGDNVFVYRTPDPSTATGGEYDDLTAWIPVSVLYSRLISAGVLP